MLGGAALILIGFQSVAFAVLAKVFAVNSGLMPWTPGFRRIFDWITLETGLIVGALAILGGVFGIAAMFSIWSQYGYGPLDPQKTLRWAIPAVTATVPRLSSRAFQLLLQHVRAGSKMTTPEFDGAGRKLRAATEPMLAVTGESVDYYAEQRVLHLARRLEQRGIRAASIPDFGCGTGTATPYFLRRLGVGSVLGVDVSTESLRTAIITVCRASRELPRPLPLRAPRQLRTGILQWRFSPYTPSESQRCLARCLYGIAAGRPVRFLGEQSLESRNPVGHESYALRPGRHQDLTDSGQTFAVRRDSACWP